MHAARSRLPPIVPALLLQALAIAVTLLALRISGVALPPWGVALLSGALAALGSRIAGLERWWLLIQLLFAPAAWLLLNAAVRPGWFLLVFIALLLVYWSTFRTRVPLYLSGPRVWQAVLALLPAARSGPALRVIDLGSGLGGLLLFLAAARREVEFQGVELAPVPMSELWLKARREMRAGSLFISSSFEVPGQEATRIITVDDARGTRLHVWRMAP